MRHLHDLCKGFGELVTEYCVLVYLYKYSLCMISKRIKAKQSSSQYAVSVGVFVRNNARF